MYIFAGMNEIICIEEIKVAQLLFKKKFFSFFARNFYIKCSYSKHDFCSLFFSAAAAQQKINIFRENFSSVTLPLLTFLFQP
jgi:hypothetical protein